MNLEGIALKLLLEESDKNRALEYYSELRPEYFSNAFATILSAIKEFYDKNDTIPSLTDLEIFRSRDKKSQSYLTALKTLDCSEYDIEFAVEELANHHAQNFTLDMFDVMLASISVKDRFELLDAVGQLPLKLEEAIQGSNSIHSPKTMNIFTKPNTVYRFPTGISNEWDAQAGGYYRQDLILVGGKRGAGKSVVCANLMHAQHLQGNPSVYFTIEMQAQEVYNRFLGIKAGIPAIKIKMDTMSLDEKKLMCKAAADLFIGGDHLFDELIATNQTPDFFDFQDRLQKLLEKEEGRIIIYEDRMLSLSTIDTVITGLKAKYGDKILLAIVDYLNQIVLTGHKDMYDWKDQITVSKGLKNIARKNDLCVVAPYQIDGDGKARFAQGILDAADVAQIIHAEDEYLEFETVKARSADDSGRSKVGMHWETLRIDPRPVVIGEEEEKEEPVKKEKSVEPSMELTL